MANKRVLHIIDNSYYGDIFNKNLVVLFRKPCDDDRENKRICCDIVELLEHVNEEFSVDDIINQVHWSDRVKETVGKSLYLQKDGYRLSSENIDVVRSRNVIGSKNYDELYDNGEQIAKVITGHSFKHLFSLLGISLVILTTMLLGVKGCAESRREKNRLNSNREAYEYDTCRIFMLDTMFQSVTSTDKPYFRFLSDTIKEDLVYRIDSLRRVANDSYDQTKDWGRYVSVQIDESGIKESIDLMVKDAQVALLNEEKVVRMRNNQDAYIEDTIKINELENLFLDATSSSQPYSSFIEIEQKENISNKITVLREKAKSNIDEVMDSGVYSPVRVDKLSITKSINDLVDNAKMKMGEEERIKNNEALYQNDLRIIDGFQRKLTNVISASKKNQYYQFIDKKQIDSIKTSMESLYKSANKSYKMVQDKGFYNAITIDTSAIYKRIQKIIDDAKQLKKHVDDADDAYIRFFKKEGKKKDALFAIEEYNNVINKINDNELKKELIERREKLKKEIEK